MSLEDRQHPVPWAAPARIALSRRPFTFKVKIVGAVVVSKSTSFIVDENELDGTQLGQAWNELPREKPSAIAPWPS